MFLYVLRRDYSSLFQVSFICFFFYPSFGCRILDEERKINGSAGLRIKFKRPGMEGKFVLFAIKGDFDKIILSGELKDKTKDEFVLQCDRPSQRHHYQIRQRSSTYAVMGENSTVNMTADSLAK